MCNPFSIGFVWLFVSLKEVIADHTINASVGTQTYVTCTLAATLPLWEGPPSFTTYLFADSSTVNPTLSHSDRLAVADGNLIINNTALTDDGDYRCSYTGQGSEIITVIVGCSLLNPPTDGAVSTTFGVPGDVATYQCEGSHTLIGQNTTTCQTDGSWSSPKPLCQGPTPPRPKCCCICCFIALIVNVVLNVVLVLVHVILTWKKHEFSVKKIYSGNNETNEAVCLKDYGIKAALPECCVCVVTIVIQIAVYFAALIQKDCGDSCDKCCEVVICLVVTIIVSIVEAAAGSGIIYIFVNVKGCSYVDQGGNVDSGDSACCGRNNSILPICAGDDQQRPDGNKQKLSQGPRHRDVGTHQPGEPNSKTTKTDESGSFVSGKDIKVDTGGSSSFRAQPLPDIKSEKKNTRGLSANIDDSDINNPSYEKKRLTPIGQESHPGWEEKTDRSEDGKEKKKKRKSKDKDKERDSNVTESADL